MVLEIHIIFKSGEELVSNSPQEKISDNQTEITTIGLWIEAFGTFLSAIGNTPISAVNQNLLFDIDRIGDVLQLEGTTTTYGNAIQFSNDSLYKNVSSSTVSYPNYKTSIFYINNFMWQYIL